MTGRGWRDELSSRLGHLRFPVPPGTLLFSVAIELERMAGSYLRDGDHFESEGDPVNAIASWSYALGWLDAGHSLGLIMAPCHDPKWIYQDIRIASTSGLKLIEKVHRYHALLSTALGAVCPAAEPDTAMSRAADRFTLVAWVNREYGRSFLSSRRTPNALGAFSYGHAWLDAGVRAGLFRIERSREIFTI